MTDPSQPASSNRTRSPLVIMNGLGAPNVAARIYGTYFRGAGFRPFIAPQSFLGHEDVRLAADRLAAYVQEVLGQTGADRVSLVGMSLGGLIGLYYLKRLDGARFVDCFVSVGGPLAGSSFAGCLRVPDVAPLRSIAQTRSHSDLVREVSEAPMPEGVRLYSLGTRGDIMTPRASWGVEGMTLRETPYGLFPIGHWTLFTHPGNLRAVVEMLDDA